jgi:2-oxoglutarate ferredoxin oxidoreductase subunit alpha
VRPVLAPISAGDTFGVTVEAFNIAEKYQTPVIILSDQEIAQRKETVEPFDARDFKLVERKVPTNAELEHYVRFRYTDTGISPVSHPGLKGGNYLAAGIEHNEHGDPTAGGETHARMNDKRIKKLDPLKRRGDLFVIEGDADAPLALLSWGSMAGVVREALRTARGEGLKVKLLVPKLLYPVAEEIYRDFFRSVQGGLVVEQSHLGQLYRLIRMFVDVPKGLESLAKSGSNPIAPAEVVARLREVVQHLQRRQSPEVESQG